jgi:hypothetical protein
MSRGDPIVAKGVFARGMPLIRMNPDDHVRCTINVMLCVLAIFLMTSSFPAASMAGKNAAGSREQGDNAY